MTQCSPTTSALAIVGLFALLVLGALFLFVLSAAFAGRLRDTSRPPYEGDAGDENDLRLTRGIRMPSEDAPLYGLPSVEPHNFDAWLLANDRKNVERQTNVHNN